MVCVGLYFFGVNGVLAQTRTYTTTQISSGAFNHESPSINNHGDVVWSQQVGGYWQVYILPSGSTAPVALPGQAPNHNNQYPAIDNAGDVLYLKDGTGAGPGLAVIENVGGTESSVQFSSGNPPGCTEPPAGPANCTSWRSAGQHFGIGSNGTTISYFDFLTSGSGPRTFVVGGVGNLAPNLTGADFPDINSNGTFVYSSSGTVYAAPVSAPESSTVVASGSMARIADVVPPATAPEIVYLSSGSQVTSTIGGVVDGGLWADVNSSGTVVYEKTVSGFNQLFLAKTCPVDDVNHSGGVANPIGLVQFFTANGTMTPSGPGGPDMFANFTASPAGTTLGDAAAMCGFIGFDWQQTIDVLPAPSPFFPINPANPSINPANLYPGPPASSKGSLQAGPPSGAPSFYDPVPGGTISSSGPTGDHWPFYYYVSDATSTAPSVACEVYDNPIIGACVPLLNSADTMLWFHDSPSDPCLPGNGTADQATIAERMTTGCGATGIPSSFIALTTSLVGIAQNPLISSVCSASAPQNCMSVPLYSWQWFTEYNGTSGGIFTLYNNLPPDPGSGTGGITITSVNGGPPPVAVPNVVGLTQAAATTAITGAGLVAGTVTTASSATVSSDSVISESPVAGTEVSTGSAVNLAVSTGLAQVAVPNVAGLTQAAATSAITGAGLVVGTVTTASSATVPSGSVISESPVAGTEVSTGSAVNLAVSSGPAQVAVPYVVGLTQAAATSAITGAGLAVGTVTTASSATVPSGSVISESPMAGTQVSTGSAVNLAVSTGPPPPVILAIAPVTGSQGQTIVNLIVTGQNTHFVQGTTTASFGAGITVNSLTVNSLTSTTANITIASSATPGSQTVTVTTGAEVASILNAFIITAPVPGLPPLTWLGGGHTGGVNSVSASPDGTVWSAGGDTTIKQWNAANMSMLRTFPVAASSTAFAGNGQQAFLVNSGGETQAVNLADGSVIRTFPSGDRGRNYLPAISANGQTVAFGQANWGPDLLIFANGQGTDYAINASYDDPEVGWVGGVGTVAVSADGQYVAAVLGADTQVPGTVRLYQVSDGALLRLLTNNTTNVQALAFSADGTMLASCSADGKINVLRLSDLVVVTSITVFESGNVVPGTTLAFSADGTKVAEGNPYAAEIYHVSNGAPAGRIPGGAGSVAFTPDGQWLVIGGGLDVRLWLIATLAPLPTVQTHYESITAVAYSPRGDLVASASADYTVKLRSAVDGTLVASLTGHTNVVNALAFSPDGNMLATGSSDDTIRIWNTSNFSLINTLTGHTQPVQALAFSPDGSLLASGSAAPEQVVKLWSVGGIWSNTSTLTGTGGSVTSVQFSPDGTVLAGASAGGIVRLWLTATGALSSTYLAPSQGAMSLAFSPTGTLLIAGWGQDILVFQGSSTAPVYSVAAHSQNGTVVAYSPDGTRVLSGNPDGTLKLWNPAGWSQITSYDLETDAAGSGVTSVGYAPDNSRFVYGRGDATIAVANTGSTAITTATVTVETNPAGMAIVVDGTTYFAPQTFSWARGSSHSVSVVSPQGSNGTRYVFLGWSDGGAQSHTVTPEQSRIYTANFVTEYLLTSQLTPAGGGTLAISPTSPDGYYTAGTAVQLTETPATGFVFGSWSGDASGATNSVSVLMTQPHSVTAQFSGTPLADIAVAMSSSVSQINSGNPLSFTVTVTDLGPAASGSMTLIVNLPPQFSFVSASSNLGNCTGTVQISCALGTIAVNGTDTATIDVTAIAAGSVSMTASVNGGTADPNPANNSATVTVLVLPAGQPPILWMGGGDYSVRSIFATTDGSIWTAGYQEIEQWRASDMQLIRTLAPDIVIGDYRDDIPDLAVTPDGKYLAYATSSAVGVYNSSDGSLVRSFGTGSWPTLTDDGQTVAYTAGCYGGTVIGHLADGSTITVPTGTCLGPAAISPDGSWLAVSNSTGVDLYTASNGSYVRSFSGFASAPKRLVWAADSDTLMAASGPSGPDNTVGASQLMVFSVSQFLELQNLSLPGSYFFSANMSRDGQFVAYGGGNSAFCGGWCAGPVASVWRVSDGSVVTTVQKTNSASAGIGFTPDDLRLICGETDHLNVYALPQGAPSANQTGNVGGDDAIAYSSAGNLIATGGADQVISIWNTSTGAMLNYVSFGNCTTAWNDCGAAVASLAFSPAGNFMAASVNDSILVWNTAGYGLTTTLTGHTDPVEAVAFSPDGTLIASASTTPEQVVKLWSTQTWSLVRTLTGATAGLRSVQFSPDGAKVVAAGDDGIGREWNVTTGAIEHSYLAPGEGSMRIQYSPDGTKLAAGWTGKVLVFNEGTATPVQTLLAHTQNNTTVAWSPDGTRLISGNPDGTVDLWDTTTWGQLSQYNSETYAQGGGVLTVAYSPDNSQFAYGRADSVVVAVASGNAPSGIVTTVTTNPQGLDIVVDGATTASPQTFRWLAGTTHTIGVPSPQGSNGTQNVFAYWSDAGTQSHTITTPSTSSTYTAQFNPQYLLTPSVAPGGSGTILVTPTSSNGYYASGTTLQAVATANVGYVFGTWSGAATGTTNPASVTMSAPQSIAANFSALPTTVVTTSPPGLLVTVDGAQYTAPQAFNWAAGTSHTVTVASTQGIRGLRYAFANWGDGGAISHTITAPNASTTYIATYNTQYPLTTNSNPVAGGTIIANPTATEAYYNSGLSVQLTATAATGYQFTGWSGDVSGSAIQQSLTMSAAHSVTANFAIVTFSPCDIKQNEIISVADVQLIINQALGGSSAVNDLNGDGVVNVADVQIEMNAVLNLGCKAN